MRENIDNVSESAVWAIAILSLFVIGWLDLVTGFEFSFLPFYFLPVALASWRLGKGASILLSLLAGFTWLFADKWAGHIYANSNALYWNAAMRMIYFALSGLILASLHESLIRKERLIQELHTLLTQVKTLEGILPICPCCGKIRSKAGRWERLDHYVRDQSNIEFLSNICPDCTNDPVVKASQT